MISTINKNESKLTYEQISKYLDINKENENKVENGLNIKENFAENDFINNEMFNKMILKIKSFLDNIGLIPYLEFRAKTTDKNLKKN